MEFIVVAYRSRADTVRFADFLRYNGIQNEIVSTPKEAGVGCGLSVKIPKGALVYAKKAVYSAKLSSFAGIFLITDYGGKRLVRTI